MNTIIKLVRFLMIFIAINAFLLKINAQIITEEKPQHPSCTEDKNMIIGKTTLTGLEQNQEFWSEYLMHYGQYEVEHHVIEQILQFLPGRNITITVVLGTWCSDSKEQFPVFEKVIDQLPPDIISVNIIGVDRDKLAGNLDISSLEIEFVPTFIFYENGQELGRIVEIPSETMEKDILHILSNKK
jgi:thiol-disulfide isomerase/thioredoxin